MKNNPYNPYSPDYTDYTYSEGLLDGAQGAFMRGVKVTAVCMTFISTMIVCGLCRHYRGEIRKILHQVASCQTEAINLRLDRGVDGNVTVNLTDSQYMAAPPEYQGAGAEGVGN